MSLILQCRRAQARRLSSVWSERPAAIPVLVTLLLLAGLAAPAQAAPLTLGAAEAQLARSNPSLAAAAQRIRAIQHQAAAATQLPDPHVSFDAVNLPTNSFSLTQQSMTMLSVGVSQSFPPIGKLALEGDKLQAQASEQHFSREAKRAQLVLALRRAWLAAVYARQAMATVQRQQTLARENVDAAMASYRAGNGPQSDVLRARLAEDELRNDQSALAADEAASLADIAQALGSDQTPQIDPDWPSLSPGATAPEQAPPTQPLLRMAQAKVQIAQAGVQVAKKDFLPEITVGASYGKSFFPGSPNFFSAGVSMNLPIFSSHRLDQELDSARAQVLEARYDEQDQRLALQQQIRTATARMRSQQEKWQRMRAHMLPLAHAAYDSTLTTYSNGRASMSDVLKAQQAVFALELQTLQQRRDLLATQAELDYLTTPSEQQP
ncbi:putative Cobalt-zinc-cadmium resistance protein czcC (Cation efflux system protein czcC) [Thiomonas sp. X19]|jgi:outer membrane protein TolC|uniref:TolC family protein n=1 Tax=Thiomonas TaxID=32012 RepID=UPI0004DF750A|nr:MULTISPECIES: TolC family protein [Thiomonas]SCC92046.1 putative Cobalt-zinc-cadmium resistance protein czcC (Cation efflux system protein czcC) [Thiomonas sp. X19]